LAVNRLIDDTSQNHCGRPTAQRGPFA